MKAYVDLGANTGKVAAEFAVEHPDFEIFCVEPNPDLISSIHSNAVRIGRTFVTMWAAAWITNGTTSLFRSTAHAASTIVGGKIEPSHWPQIDYNVGLNVPCFDFSAWMLKTFHLTDYVVLKMDIEGSEYAILDKMLADRSLSLVNELRCEWHHDRYPEIGEARHNEVRNRAKSVTHLIDWH